MFSQTSGTAASSRDQQPTQTSSSGSSLDKQQRKQKKKSIVRFGEFFSQVSSVLREVLITYDLVAVSSNNFHQRGEIVRVRDDYLVRLGQRVPNWLEQSFEVTSPIESGPFLRKNIISSSVCLIWNCTIYASNWTQACWHAPEETITHFFRWKSAICPLLELLHGERIVESLRLHGVLGNLRIPDLPTITLLK